MAGENLEAVRSISSSGSLPREQKSRERGARNDVSISDTLCVSSLLTLMLGLQPQPHVSNFTESYDHKTVCASSLLVCCCVVHIAASCGEVFRRMVMCLHSTTLLSFSTLPHSPSTFSLPRSSPEKLTGAPGRRAPFWIRRLACPSATTLSTWFRLLESITGRCREGFENSDG